MGKHVKQPSGATCLMTVKPDAISKDELMPGQVIYSDQFIARMKGKSASPFWNWSEGGIHRRHNLL